VADVAVVHLVRRANGAAPLERFLASYREKRAGLDHGLIVVFKGFRGQAVSGEYARLLEGLPHEALHLPDRGFDLQPYFVAARRFQYRYFCFLNSFSRVLSSDWLAKLHRWAVKPGTGVVGATASYESFVRGHEERRRELEALRPWPRFRSRFRHVVSDPSPRLVAQRTGAWLFDSVGLWKPTRHFPPFPNYHVRTNALMVSREVLLRIRVRPLFFKLSAYLLESGYDGVTQQVMRMGLRPLLIDRSGEKFEKERWHLANTFRQSRQEDLLVEDNQTEAYAKADSEQRIRLSRAAWGEYARPA
jgi:hypothetical protein